MVIIKTEKELKPRDKHDFYPTPVSLCRAAISLLPEEPHYWFLDPGAGTGPWGIAARQLYSQSYIAGIERYECHFCPYDDVYDDWHYGNFLEWTPKVKFNAVIGNPPYRFAQQFVEKSLDILPDGGYLLFLLRLAFLESQKRHAWWRESPLKKTWVLSRRPSFTGDGHTDETAYALYMWQKGYDGVASLSWLWWESEDA